MSTIFFDDPDVDAQFGRTLYATVAGSADLGEAFATARRVTPGDLGSWYREWTATGESVRRRMGDDVWARLLGGRGRALRGPRAAAGRARGVRLDRHGPRGPCAAGRRRSRDRRVTWLLRRPRPVRSVKQEV